MFLSFGTPFGMPNFFFHFFIGASPYVMLCAPFRDGMMDVVSSIGRVKTLPYVT